ncbi:hypothetical protein Tsp_07427 [Trichinella spiralis]|uniref:hypothetical protein n=1 Tax=Trichinella spiralis TaxID=6334 RepID=UPI0001EFCD46|nr:hypothetical protein Tsp_07427 [Trichinella spiralis]
MVDRLSICKNDSYFVITHSCLGVDDFIRSNNRDKQIHIQPAFIRSGYPLSTLDYTTADCFIFTTTLASTPIAVPRTRNHNATKHSFLYHSDSFVGRDDDHDLSLHVFLFMESLYGESAESTGVQYGSDEN